jgi:transposase
MNTLDKNNIKGQYIVMDDAPIHKPKVIKALIEERGHKSIYLPPYSPFLNPIEEFWSKVKAGGRRTPLAADDCLTDRICESARKATKKYCKGWIEHSKSFFENCLNEERNLKLVTGE